MCFDNVTHITIWSQQIMPGSVATGIYRAAVSVLVQNKYLSTGSA